MPIFLRIILYTFMAGVVGTGLGGFIGASFKKDSNKTMSLLLSLAGGIMLAIVCFDLILSAINDFGGESSKMSVIYTVLFTAMGVGIVYVLNNLIDRYSARKNKHIDSNHPKTHDDLDELIHSDTLRIESQEKRSKSSLLYAGILMVFAIALHNFPEGMVIGSSYAKDSSEISGDLDVAFLLTLLIALHNIPEGMAISVPLISGGMSKFKAVMLTALSGFPTVLGAIGGYFLGSVSDFTLAISLSLASGAMLYVVFGEILPQAILMYRSKLPTFFMMLGMLIGLLLIYIL